LSTELVGRIRPVGEHRELRGWDQAATKGCAGEQDKRKRKKERKKVSGEKKTQ
jgi:hypothetical protein